MREDSGSDGPSPQLCPPLSFRNLRLMKLMVLAASPFDELFSTQVDPRCGDQTSVAVSTGTGVETPAGFKSAELVHR